MTENKKAAECVEAQTTAESGNSFASSVSAAQLYNNIPEKLKGYKNWVVRKGKTPINPVTGYGARANDQTTWASYETALDKVKKYDGIGFELGQSPFVGIDLDHHVIDGVPDDFAKEILRQLNSYSEISPSGTGIHILVEAANVSAGFKNGKHNIEVYSDKRYLTVTGNVLSDYGGGQVQERTAELMPIIERYETKKKEPVHRIAAIDSEYAPPSDDKLIELMRRYDKSGKFIKLFDNGDLSDYEDDHSRADSALLETLAYWTHCDSARMESIFSRSQLAQRNKWAERADYRTMSITAAISSCIGHSKKIFTVPAITFDPGQCYDENDKFLHNRFGDWLIKTYNIVRAYPVGQPELAYTSPILFYNTRCGYYQLFDVVAERIMIGFMPELKTNQRLETKKYIDSAAPIREKAGGNLIALKNGIYDLDSRQLLTPDKKYIVTEQIPVAYDPTQVHNEKLLSFIGSFFYNDKEFMKFMFEVIGYGLAPSNFMQKLFVFSGDGQNGKSALFKLLFRFYGKDNVSALQLEDIEKRFVNAELYGKIINIGDDIGNNLITETSLLKKIVTGDPVTVERKNKDPFAFAPRIKLLFSTNKMPRINDTSYGMNRRLIMVPFTRIFNGPEADPNIVEKVATPEGLSCLLNHALDGLIRIRTNKTFTLPPALEKLTAEYIDSNDPIKMFVTEVENGEVSETYNFNNLFSFEHVSTAAAYNKYTEWARESGLRPLARNNFGKELSRLGYKKTEVSRPGCRFVYRKH